MHKYVPVTLKMIFRNFAMYARQLAQTASTSLRRFYCTPVKSKDEIDRLVKASKVVLFMKGTPEEPMCGFSRVVSQILRMHDVKYQSYNVLDDQSIRDGVKKYSDWPTIPQLYVDGKFIGGADIAMQMHQNGELVQVLKDAGIKSAMVERSGESQKGEK